MNQVYSAIVPAVTAAKSHPNFQDCRQSQYSCQTVGSALTRIPQTMVISSAVGTT